MAARLKRRPGHPIWTARAQVQQAAVAAANSSAYLFHDGANDRLIAILDIEVTKAPSGEFAVGYVQAQGATPGMRGVALLPGDRAPIGLTSSGSQVGFPGSVDFLVGNSNSNGHVWGHAFPLAVLRTGWALVLTNTTINQAVNVGFFYEVLTADDLTAAYEWWFEL